MALFGNCVTQFENLKGEIVKNLTIDWKNRKAAPEGGKRKRKLKIVKCLVILKTFYRNKSVRCML